VLATRARARTPTHARTQAHTYTHARTRAIHSQHAFRYTSDELERAQTHDDLWNAAQLQMVRYEADTTARGSMTQHGMLRGCDVR
jgi:hypothetical protein